MPTIGTCLAGRPHLFPAEQRQLQQLGERLRLARRRRRLGTAVVAQRAGITRSSLYKIETGYPGLTLGTFFFRIMAVLGLSEDLDALAADDKVGRRLQDLDLQPASRVTVRSGTPAGRR